MNELQVKGTQSFMGKEIPVVEGGFGEGQKVILAKTIAKIHEVELKEINRLINNNIDEFEERIDILDLKNNGDYQAPLQELGFSNRDISISKNIYLLSEQGYMALVMLMRTEKAKEIRKQLRKEYFAMREVINSNEQLKAKLLLDIYNGGQEGVIASKELVELEKKPLLETIEKQQPKVNTFDKFMNAEGLYTSTQMAKLFKMPSAMKLNKLLNAEGLIYKQGNTWMPYATTNKEWFKVIVREREGHAFTQLKFTPIGVVEIAKILNVELNEDDLVDQNK